MLKKVCKLSDIPNNGGAAVLVDGEQIAIFSFENGKELYAVQNLCPHKQQMCLSRGIIGDHKGVPKVVCPLHKNAFDLKEGRHIGGDESWTLKTYDVKIEGEDILLSV